MNLTTITEPTQVRIATNGQTASVRTRRRVKQNGPDFLVLPKFAKSGHIFVTGLDGNGWSGWLPLREIKITQPSRS